MTHVAPQAWSAGVLHPGKLRWLRLLGWGALLVLVVGGVPSVLGFVFRSMGAHGYGATYLLHVALSCAAGLGAYAAAVRYGERRPVLELDPSRALPDLAFGLASGAGLFAAVMLMLVASGGYTLTGPHYAAPWTALSLSLASGTIEELVFRGILFRLVWGALGLGWALGISAGVFGLLHLLNPTPDLIGALSLIVEAGLVLATLYIVTGRLYASIGAHFAWNFSQGYVFGAQVSGMNFGPSLLTAHAAPGASRLLTGGGFGPEASLPAIGAGLLAAGALLYWRRKRFA